MEHKLPLTKTQVADILDEIGTLLELRGENPFKCRAYHNAARVLSSITTDLSTLIESDGLRNLSGIGKAIAENIIKVVQTGRLRYHEELQGSLPPGLLEMMRIQGLGPKRIKILYDTLKISSIEELRQAAANHSIADLAGFGKKTEENIVAGIDQLARQVDKYLCSVAKEAADRICDVIRKQPGVLLCEIAGSLRRRKEVIGDIDILVAATDKHTAGIIHAFTTHTDVETILGSGKTKASVRLLSGIQCDIRVIQKKEYPFALSYFTGSKEHNVVLRSRAKELGWSLNEYGFSALGATGKRGPDKRIVACKNEKEIYWAMKLQYIPPELRESYGEFEAAETRSIPDLIEEEELLGTFHCHTTYSDGKNTLTEMAEAARLRGWQYLGIADHSKIAAYAGGLSVERVRDQLAEIDSLNSSYKGFRIFKGTEVDILGDGQLDWSDTVLSMFDYVVASVHSKFKLTESEMTKRIIRAIKNKYVTMLGHPTGRLLTQRDQYPVNMIDVINAAADYGKVIEINANPRRLDLDWRFCKYARDKGVLICINPDAHSTGEISDVQYGVGVARKGWLGKKDILNTRTTKDISKFFQQR